MLVKAKEEVGVKKMVYREMGGGGERRRGDQLILPKFAACSL